MAAGAEAERVLPGPRAAGRGDDGDPGIPRRPRCWATGGRLPRCGEETEARGKDPERSSTPLLGCGERRLLLFPEARSRGRRHRLTS